MGIANEIVISTERFRPSILHDTDGSVTIHWPRRQLWGTLRKSRLAEAAGLDEALFCAANGEIMLHIPAELA